jgi:hypothetical protein
LSGVIRTPVRIGTGLVCLALLAACTSAKPTRFVTVTHTPSRPQTSVSSPPSTSAPAPSSTAAPTPSATPTLSRLRGTCDTLLPDSDVEQALGGPLPGGTDAFVVGAPDPVIHRVGYLNCRYGVTGRGAAATPAIEIGISLYRTAAQAAARITATVDDYDAHGAAAIDATVNGRPATILSGGAGAGYDVPLLVVAFGQRTVAVSIGSVVATGSKASTDAEALAGLALDRSGH